MLLLDIGNSAVKGQCWQGDALQQSFSCRFATGWQQRFEACLANVSSESCYYISVLGEVLQAEVDSYLSQYFGPTTAIRLGVLEQCQGVRNGYRSASVLGSDRWFALLAAAGLTDRDVMIVDAGSAITIDLLRSNGQHLGGAILPGFNTSITRFKEILHRADFEHADIEQIDIPGLTTEACIHISHGLTDSKVVDTLVERWFARLSEDAMLIVTGGDAHLIPKSEKHDYRMVPDLVFQGMRRQLDAKR